MHIVERGTGTPLVLIHGFGVDHRILLPLDPVVADAGGWQRLYVDLPGHGGTPGDGVDSSEDVVTVVAAALEERLGGLSFAVLGNSFGGMIARRIAHDFDAQVLGLATIAGVFVAEPTVRDLPARSVLVEDASVLEALDPTVAAEYAGIAVVQSAEDARTFVRYVLPGVEAADAATLERIAARYTLAVEPEDASSSTFDRPALFVTGRQDHVVGFRDAWARLHHYPRATFATLDAAGHNAHLDRRSPTASLVADWLARMRADAREP